MELKTGMYVRTKKGIAKIIGKNDDVRYHYPNAYISDTYLEINDDTEYLYEEDIIKGSSNILDLIECLDLVELYISGLEEYDVTTIKRPETLSELEGLKNYIKQGGKIKSITTREQFENARYKIK